MIQYNKRCLFILLILLAGGGVQAQSSTSLSVEAGGLLSSFQDNKYSQVRFRGAGGAFALGYERLNPGSIWGARLLLMGGGEYAATHDQGAVTQVNPRVEVHYLRKIQDNLYVGAHWDVLNLYNKQFEGLGNNSNYYLTSSNLFASAAYHWNKFQFGLDLGLLSYAKEGTGFAFSAPQAATENGEFDYLDDALINPLRLRFGEITGLGPNLHVRTQVQYQISDRWNLAYEWNFRRYQQVPGYAAVLGYNMLNLKFDIINKDQP